MVFLLFLAVVAFLIGFAMLRLTPVRDDLYWYDYTGLGLMLFGVLAIIGIGAVAAWRVS